LVGETGAMNETDLFAMGGDLPQGVHQYYANTYNTAYPTPHGYAKGGVAQGYAKFKVLYIPYSGKTEEKMFDFYSDAYRYYDDLVDDEKGGGTTTIILQGYSDEYDEFEDIFYFDPMEMSEEDEDFAKGGMMQGYNDRLDESLGNRDGVEPMMMQSYKDRRDESKGMEKSMGRRAYQSVGTMDKMAKGGELKSIMSKKDIGVVIPKTYQIGDKEFGNTYKVKRVNTKKYSDNDKNRHYNFRIWEYDKSLDLFDEIKSPSGKLKALERIEMSKDYAKGGKTQGYNDRLDESLGNRDGVEPMMMQSYKDRRDESKGMEKSMGRRAYQSVGTMDNVGNPTDPNVLKEMEIFIKKEIPKLDKERFFTDGMKRKEAKRKFYKKYGYGAYNPRFSIFEKGGKIGFDGLAKKVAKRYVGKPVPAKFREEYGKTYSKAEAMEVGNKVAGKVYREQQAMAHGGKIGYRE